MLADLDLTGGMVLELRRRMAPAAAGAAAGAGIKEDAEDADAEGVDEEDVEEDADRGCSSTLSEDLAAT